MLNWHTPQDYHFTDALNAAQWAWEFLRRNPGYRHAWREFHATWQALEATYGKPAQRDIAAWKRDPRAWVPAAECSESDCRVDGEKVLIECAMGARWGFYKFPPDPADDDPVGGGKLTCIHAEAPESWRRIGSRWVAGQDYNQDGIEDLLHSVDRTVSVFSGLWP